MFQDHFPHPLKNFFQARLPDVVGDGSKAECLAEDTGVRVAVNRHGVDGKRTPHDRLHAQGKRVRMNAALSVQQGPVYVEEISVAVVPAESFTDGYEALSRRWINLTGRILH